MKNIIKNILLLTLLLNQIFAPEYSHAASKAIVKADITEGQDSVPNFLKGKGHYEKTVVGTTAYADAAGTRPVDGTGGAPTLTCTRTTSYPLDGDGSLLITKDAANRQGQGCAIQFTIDSAYKAKVLQIEMDYIVASGTFSAGSSTTDSDLIVYIYDVTNSTLIEPSSIKFLASSTTLPDKFVANFQTSATGTTYNLILHQATTSASAYTWKGDNFKVTPSRYVYGTPITDWQSYTLTIGGSTSAPTVGTSTSRAIWRRVGDSMEIKYYLNQTGAGSAGSGTYLFPLPSGSSIDTNKATVTTNGSGLGGTALGSATAGNTTSAGSNNATVGTVIAYNTTNLAVQLLATTIGQTITLGSTNYALSGATILYQFEASVPISGWSSSTQVSDGWDARVIGLKVSSTGTTGTLNTSDNVVKHAATTINDTTASYSASTGLWTCPRSDWYIVSGSYGISHTTASGYISASIGVNGTIVAEDYRYVNGAADSQQSVQSQAIYITAGQTVGLYSKTSLTTPAFTATSKNNWFSIIAAKSPQTMSATEKMVASYGDNSGQSITTSNQIIGFNTLTEDTHAIKSGTGTSTQFIIPYQGSFRIFAQLQTGATTSSGNQYFIPKIYIDGSPVAEGGNRFPTSHISPTGTVEWTGPLNAGQIVTIRLDTDVAASRSLSSSAASNRMSIIRIK